MGRDASGKIRFNCRLSATRSLNEKEKFKLRGSSVPCVLVITQSTAGGSHVHTKVGEISIQILTEIEQNCDCFIDDSDYSSPIF